MDVREKLEVIAHLGDHISYKEDIGICYDSTLAKVIEDAYMTLKNGVTVQEWIPASEPPEEHNSIWAKLYGTKSWQPGLFRKCSYDVLACVEKKDGSRRVISTRTYDGKWDHNKLNEETVICWQPLPQPPKGE